MKLTVSRPPISVGDLGAGWSQFARGKLFRFIRGYVNRQDAEDDNDEHDDDAGFLALLGQLNVLQISVYQPPNSIL